MKNSGEDKDHTNVYRGGKFIVFRKNTEVPFLHSILSVTRLRTWRTRNHGSIPGRGKDFCVLKCVQTNIGLKDYRVFLPRG